MTIKAYGEFGTMSEAIQHTDASGRGVAIAVEDRYFVVAEDMAEKMEAAGVEFAYLHDVNGRLVTVPAR